MHKEKGEGRLTQLLLAEKGGEADLLLAERG